MKSSSSADEPTAGAAIDSQVKALAERVDELERELEQTRRLHVRVAELTDIVQELLLPVAQRDTELLADRLRVYADSL